MHSITVCSCALHVLKTSRHSITVCSCALHVLKTSRHSITVCSCAVHVLKTGIYIANIIIITLIDSNVLSSNCLQGVVTPLIDFRRSGIY